MTNHITIVPLKFWQIEFNLNHSKVEKCFLNSSVFYFLLLLYYYYYFFVRMKIKEQTNINIIDWIALNSIEFALQGTSKSFEFEKFS